MNALRYRHWLALVFFALLASCARMQLTPEEQAKLTPQAEAYALQGEFNNMLHLAVAYSKQPACTPQVVVACADANIKAKLLAAAEEGKTALDAYKAAVQGGGDSVSGAASVLRNLLAKMQGILLSATGGS